MLCRLCVKETCCFLNIFASDGIKLNIAEILGRHFWFKPRADDRMTSAICTMCWSKVYNFHQFYIAIEQAHSTLHSTSNVEKEFVDEYVGIEFADKGVVKEEPTFSALEEKVFVGSEFIGIDVIVKESLGTPCSRVGSVNESIDLEFCKIGVNTKELPGDFCLNDGDQNDPNNPLLEQVSDIHISDNLNEECDKLNTESVVDSNNFADDISLCNAQSLSLLPKIYTRTAKNRKSLIATEKSIPKLIKKRVAKTEHNEKNKISADTSLLHCDIQKTALLPKRSTETARNQKRLTRPKEKFSKLEEKRVMSEKSKILTDASLSNDEVQEPALEKPTEPIREAYLSYCNPQELEVHNYKTHVSDKSLSNCDSVELLPLKSTKSIADAYLSNFDTPEPQKKSTKSVNRKNRTVSQKKITELRQKRGLKILCSDDELVKKYIAMSCDLCIFDCEEFEILKSHYRADHPNIKPYVKCCNRKWLNWLSIVDHAYKHENPELLKCQECQKDFTDLGTLSRHMADFHESEKDKVFGCDLCQKKFLLKRKLEIHRTLHIPMNERKFVCDQCPNYRFGCDVLLRAHIRKIHRRSCYVCHVCGKEFKNKTSFDKHVRLHFEERGPKVKCTFEGCESWLTDNDNLRLHIHRHHTKRKERVFTCEVCGGEYKSRASVTSHMLRVHPKKTFPCGICNKIFKKAFNLREHMAQHTGERNYKCVFCTSTFNTNGNYYTHLKNLHTVEYENWRKDYIKTGGTSLLRLKN